MIQLYRKNSSPYLKRIIRQQEVVHEQQDSLKDASATSEHNLDFVKNRTNGPQKGKGYKNRTQMNKNVSVNVPDVGKQSMHETSTQLIKLSALSARK